MSVPKETFRVFFPDIALLPRKPYSLHDEAILVPTAVNVLLQGEFLSPFINSGRMTRNPAGPNNPMAFPCYDLKGDYNIQYSKKPTFLMGGRWQAMTWVFDRTPGVIASLGQPLAADLQLFEGGNRSVLTAAAGTDAICAYVLELPGSSTAGMKILSAY